MPEYVVKGRIGPGSGSDSGEDSIRLGRTLEQVVSDAHGRFYESASRGGLFSDGIGLTAINNVTYTTGTLGPTVTPIVGVYNPATSTVNLAILQATLAVTMTALAATGGGPYVWAASVGNTAVSTGSTPLNRKTLALSGSQAKGLSNVAPTGLTNNLVVRFGSALGGGSVENVTFTATAVAMQTQLLGFVENFDGSLVVPPGGVLALLATTTPVAHSVTSSLLWEEVAV